MKDATFPPDWIPLTQQVPEYNRKILVTARGYDPEIAHLSSITTGQRYIKAVRFKKNPPYSAFTLKG